MGSGRGGSNTPLHMLIKEKKPEAEVLRQLDADKSAAQKKDRVGNLPVHCAIKHGAGIRVIQKLLAVYPESTQHENNDK